MTHSTNVRRPARVSSPAVALLTLATVACAAVALGSEAAAARPPVAIEIASTPKIQTVGPRIVVHGDRSTLELGTAMFTITVKNAGAVGLSGVNVTDPRSPACNRKLGTLAAGASISYRCSARRVARSHRNVVTVSGRPSTGARDLARAGALATATAGSLVRVRARVTSRAGVPLFTG